MSLADTRDPARNLEPGTPEWLSHQLTTLLASPHIHFTQPKLPGLQLRMGPGPIDLFSTRFANMFTQDATGVLGGNAVDLNGLKDGLLALQKRWKGDSVQTESAQTAEGYQVRLGCLVGWGLCSWGGVDCDEAFVYAKGCRHAR